MRYKTHRCSFDTNGKGVGQCNKEACYAETMHGKTFGTYWCYEHRLTRMPEGPAGLKRLFTIPDLSRFTETVQMPAPGLLPPGTEPMTKYLHGSMIELLRRFEKETGIPYELVNVVPNVVGHTAILTLEPNHYPVP
jgi:hypothetical protein